MQQKRKNEHLFLAEQLYDPQHHFDHVRFIHHSLPETTIDSSFVQDTLFNQMIAAPIYINAMTGGSLQAKKINEKLAIIARELSLPMATGSMSAAIKFKETSDSFTVIREQNKNGIVMANIGAEYPIDDVKYIIDLIQADALQIHLNTVQEAIMPEGRREFHFLEYITQLKQELSLPIIIKEVGFGMSKETLKQLEQLNIQYVDISGRGGTNFAAIESHRANQRFDYMTSWGQTTVESLLEASQTPMTVFASGGVQTPLDVVKCLALNADYVGIAGMILHHIMHHTLDESIEFMHHFIEDIASLYALLGATTKADLRHTDLLLSESLVSYCNQRHIDIHMLSSRSQQTMI